MYEDEVKKLAFFKERIIQNFIGQDIYPTDALIKDKLETIDSMLNIFQYKYVKDGDIFNADKFNEDVELILADLKILYELAYKITVQDFDLLKNQCESSLAELQSMANRYEYRAKMELSSTYLGDTVLYTNTGQNVSVNNGTVIIDLGTVNVQQQAQLICILEGDNIDFSTVAFLFTDKDGNQLSCSPYAFNGDRIKVPGILKTKSYNHTVTSEYLNGPFIVTPAGIVPNRDNKYILYGGKNFMRIGYISKKYVEKIIGTPVYLDGGNVIVFHVVGGSYINFDWMSGTPLSTNFSGNSISNLMQHQKIIIEFKNNLLFDFETDGNIYATQEEALILNNDLYYPVADNVTDVLIEEYSVGDTVEYSVQVIIGSTDLPSIKGIAVKQLSVLEEVVQK